MGLPAKRFKIIYLLLVAGVIAMVAFDVASFVHGQEVPGTIVWVKLRSGGKGGIDHVCKVKFTTTSGATRKGQFTCSRDNRAGRQITLRRLSLLGFSGMITNEWLQAFRLSKWGIWIFVILGIVTGLLDIRERTSRPPSED